MMWAEGIVAYFNAPSQHLPARTEENHDNFQLG
jgi:hypothetical protein